MEEAYPTTMLEFAVNSHNTELAKALLKHGARVTEKNAKGVIVLDAAIDILGKHGTAHAEIEAILRAMVEMGTDISEVDMNVEVNGYYSDLGHKTRGEILTFIDIDIDVGTHDET